MKTMLLMLGLMLMAAPAYAHCGTCGMDDKHAVETHEADRHYTCPMHPAEKSDKPGKCRTCGMPLVLAGVRG